jgi:Na+/proline symporter/nitrogen-specific signal transduction histidine kinase
MPSLNLIIGVCLLYVAFLFLVAFAAEKAAQRGQTAWLRSPLVYTLSLSVYCTGWTFFGAVGYAARSGLEFVTIYLGPTLVLIGWFALLRKLVRVGRTQRITSIADLISSRYGKSPILGVFVTILCVTAGTPYIALQLQSVTLAFQAFTADAASGLPTGSFVSTGAWVAAGLALFTIIFGTRNLDVDEKHNGVVMAIAVEAVVKLVALIAVGLVVLYQVAGGPAPMLAMIDAAPIAQWNLAADRWIALTFVSAAAFICLPRMFHVLVVENTDEHHLATAAWAFPLYLFLISLFVVPIAVAGLAIMPAGSNPDTFVLTVPLALGHEWLALLSFLGGFSAATSMVIVASIALSTMVSNHIVMPIWLRARTRRGADPGDVRNIVLMSRRITIAAILTLGYVYYDLSGGGTALAAIGLIAFVGVAQILPALVGGLFWRGATRNGAAIGLVTGFSVWAYTFFLPSFGPGAVLSAATFESGPFGLALLRPEALFGIGGMDPFVHAVLWSLLLNTAGFVLGSLLTFPQPIERLQGASFVNVYRYSSGPTRTAAANSGDAEDLLVMAQRIIGNREAQTLFQQIAEGQGKPGFLPDVTPAFLQTLERRLAGSVGAATAHAMIGQITGAAAVSVDDLMKVADEAAQIMEYSSQLEAKSAELERTARQLREANDKLTQLSIQKDSFLSQISHELRTPMTSIRAFSEILMDGEPMTQDERARYSRIIHDEARRLTRLLDDLLDLSVLENGKVTLRLDTVQLSHVIDRALDATRGQSPEVGLLVHRDRPTEAIAITTDPDRLAQVFINLITNTQKYCAAERPELWIRVSVSGDAVTVDFVDNGRGIPRAKQGLIFEKFFRLSDARAAGGAGLGLAICREVMDKLGGSIAYLPGQGGAAFRVVLPLAQAAAA